MKKLFEDEIIGIIAAESGIQIKVLGERHHGKASESYLDVKVMYPNGDTFDWSIPTQYRRTGTDLSEATEEEITQYLSQVAEACHPSKWGAWRKEQEAFWKTKAKAGVTKEFFDVLAAEFKWCSVDSNLPKNPNFARRVQDLKELGYTISTNTNMRDSSTGINCTHLIMLPLPRGGVSGDESWSPQMRDKIIRGLQGYDVYEAKTIRKESLLPDHKFPEIRWDENTRRETLTNLSESEIKRDFQLLNNQRNQQKREVCRSCYQTNKRGYPYGIKFYYKGDENWGKDIPKRGKNAEAGCVGCGWYDLETWRQRLIEKLIAAEKNDG